MAGASNDAKGAPTTNPLKGRPGDVPELADHFGGYEGKLTWEKGAKIIGRGFLRDIWEWTSSESLGDELSMPVRWRGCSGCGG